MRLVFSGSFSTPLSHILQTPRTTSRNPGDTTRTMASVLNNLFGGKASDSPDPVQAGGDPGKHIACLIISDFPHAIYRILPLKAADP